MSGGEKRLNLSVIIAVVSGKNAVRRCLRIITAQTDAATAEIIVPFDCCSAAVGELAAEFPDVNFLFVEDLGTAARIDVKAREHRLYDRRRAAGLAAARGRIIAMTEDHAAPASDWCERILTAHERRKDVAVIGGAIENRIFTPLNEAWYFCDFGRYGRPLGGGEVKYVSDVNVSYKRGALTAIRDEWLEAYHETSVHWRLAARGERLFLDDEIVVYQERPPLKLAAAWRERVEWGRIFAETRANRIGIRQRLLFAAGCLILPFVLFSRVARQMRRQKRTARRAASVLPLAAFLLAGWSIGEFLGYCSPAPPSANCPKKLAAEDCAPAQPV